MSSEGQPRGAGQLRRAAAAEEDSGGVGASGGAGAGSATAGAAKMRTGSNEEAMMLINLIGQLSKSESQSEREQQKQEMQRELDLHDMQVCCGGKGRSLLECCGAESSAVQSAN